MWDIVGHYLTVDPQDYERQVDGTDIFGKDSLIEEGTKGIQEDLLLSDVTPSNDSEEPTYPLFQL